MPDDKQPNGQTWVAFVTFVLAILLIVAVVTNP